MTDWVGYLAATLTTASFLPQVWLIFRTRNVAGISLCMYAVFTLGTALWLAWGVLIGAWPVVAANGITLLLAMAVLVMKLALSRRSADGRA
jgi:MtN3 and saliva related transmembrane protein